MTTSGLKGWRKTLSSLLSLRPENFHRLLERIGDLVRVLAAGLGEVRAAAATAADDGGDVFEPLAGVQAEGDEVRGQAGGEVDLAVNARREQHRQV